MCLRSRREVALRFGRTTILRASFSYENSLKMFENSFVIFTFKSSGKTFGSLDIFLY